MPPPTFTQKLAVVLAFLAAALSLTAAAIRFWGRGELAITPLVGGLVMVAFGIAGYRRLTNHR